MTRPKWWRRHRETPSVPGSCRQCDVRCVGVCTLGPGGGRNRFGKTVIAGHIIKRVLRSGQRVMVIAHREELIFQAAKSIARITGEDPDIEMADLYAAESSLHGKSPVVVSTVQTQVAGKGRMQRFDPAEFGMCWIDEAHHAVASTYRRVIDHYRQNDAMKVLGVTATPDRTDEEALGQVFDEVAFDYDIRFGVDDGWLVPIVQRAVHVEHLDLSACRTTAGDLNGADLSRVMEYEQTLHEIASPTIEIAAGRKALVFASSVAHAERLCEILNRHEPDSARWVHGGTPKPERRQMFADYAARKFQFLVNVGVATEGFDDPGVELVVLARPTKSRSLYAQMIGRGTRPLPGVIDSDHLHGFDVFRRQAIAESAKPHVEIVDFVGNCGKHRLVTSADILGGNYSDDVIERAKEAIERDGTKNVSTALDDAANEIKQEREKKQREDAERRRHLVAQAKYSTTEVSPFDALGLTPWREKGWDKGRQITPKMRDLLERQGVETKDLNYTQARQLITEITSRWDSDKCSYKQAKLLAKRGLPTNVSRNEAKAMIDDIAKREGWGKKKREKREPTAAAVGDRY